MKDLHSTAFVPQLIIGHGVMDIDFYKKAFGAVETKHFTNDDGSIHVSEMLIDGAMFHIHEEAFTGTTFSPKKHNGITTIIGLMVNDVDEVMARAIAAGAQEISPTGNYDYGYRQGTIKDPFGHEWLIEMGIYKESK
jgi:PhnB protein